MARVRASLLTLIPLLSLASGQDPCPGCTLQTYWGSEDTLSVATRGIFAIWWDPQFDHGDDAEPLFETLEYIRDDCLYSLGMADPPNPSAGFYYNVYIHHGDQDLFPNGWALGQGTDPYGFPFLTVPHGSLPSTAFITRAFISFNTELILQDLHTAVTVSGI